MRLSSLSSLRSRKRKPQLPDEARHLSPTAETRGGPGGAGKDLLVGEGPLRSLFSIGEAEPLSPEAAVSRQTLRGQNAPVRAVLPRGEHVVSLLSSTRGATRGRFVSAARNPCLPGGEVAAAGGAAERFGSSSTSSLSSLLAKTALVSEEALRSPRSFDSDSVESASESPLSHDLPETERQSEAHSPCASREEKEYPLAAVASHPSPQPSCVSALHSNLSARNEGTSSHAELRLAALTDTSLEAAPSQVPFRSLQRRRLPTKRGRLPGRAAWGEGVGSLWTGSGISSDGKEPRRLLPLPKLAEGKTQPVHEQRLVRAVEHRRLLSGAASKIIFTSQLRRARRAASAATKEGEYGFPSRRESVDSIEENVHPKRRQSR